MKAVAIIVFKLVGTVEEATSSNFICSCSSISIIEGSSRTVVVILEVLVT